MAVRRMISINIVNSDVFLSLPKGAQALYCHLLLRADDDGFVNNPRMIMRLVRSTERDLTQLLDEGFLIPFENGVVAITHWRIHNLIRKNRYIPTPYQELLAAMVIKPNGEYAKRPVPAEDGPGTAMVQPTDRQRTAQVR